MNSILPSAEIFLSSPKLIAASAYIHIPFCRRRCYYCDFPISVLGNYTDINNSLSIKEYVAYLCQEIKTSLWQGTSLSTIFFGGGTPSLLPAKYLSEVILTLDKQLNIASDAEISMEIDPGTFTLEQLQGYKAAGVNRVSLGVQAFQSQLLASSGRSHSLEDVYAAVDCVKQVGFNSFSLDLISGLPHQSIQQWEESLEKAIAIAPNHLSCYDLVLEPVTAFGKRYEIGQHPLPTDESAAHMYKLAQLMLTSGGYEHYEISNYAKPGYQCRHNKVYWENQAYYAFGMGAASYLKGVRFTRPRTRKDYYAWVEQGCLIEENPVSLEDFLLETLMLGLRMAKGVNLAKLRFTFGEDIIKKIYACLEGYSQQGLVEFVKTKEEERVKLSDPEGFLFSNSILASLFEALEGAI